MRKIGETLKEIGKLLVFKQDVERPNDPISAPVAVAIGELEYESSQIRQLVREVLDETERMRKERNARKNPRPHRLSR
jgi:hypothetical protein